MSLSPHHTRLITAAALIALVAGGIFVGGWAKFAVAGLVSAAGLWEFLSLFLPGRERLGLKVLGAAAALAFLLAAYLERPGLGFGVLMGTFWLLNLRFLADYSRGRADYPGVLLLLAGLFYLPLSMQFFFRFNTPETLLVLVAAFLSDTGAFYAGTWFGNRKIWPKVSPKKTWAGSWGGLACCTAGCLGLGLLWGLASWPAYLLLGLALGVAAQAGDFFESALKRHLDVKDSGRLLPGHGGVLDRIDSLLLVVPAYAAARALHVLF